MNKKLSKREKLKRKFALKRKQIKTDDSVTDLTDKLNKLTTNSSNNKKQNIDSSNTDKSNNDKKQNINSQIKETDEKDNIKHLLYYLATIANPRRFYPFPKDLRTPNDNILFNKFIADNNISKSSTQIEEKYINPPTNSCFSEYTDVQYQYISWILKNINKLDQTSKDVLAFRKYILDENIHMSYHGTTFNKHIEEYQFKYSNVEERLRDATYKKRWYLYHGSHQGNWHSILRNGIKSMSGTSMMTNGAVHGNGVYATNDISMAISYGYSGKYSFVAVIELNEDPAQYKRSGYNIYVIPSDKYLVPRYLFKINKTLSVKVSASDILTFYKTSKENTINPRKTSKNIIKKTVISLSKHFDILHEHNDIYTIILRNNIQLQINLDNFPYSPPIIKVLSNLRHPLHKSYDSTQINIGAINGWMPTCSLEKLLLTISNQLKNNIVA